MAGIPPKARLITGILSAGFLTLATARAQQVELPAGANRDLVAHECAACHDLDMVVAGAGASREVWKATINEMISYGALIDPEDQAKILDYLASALGPNTRKPTNR
jgi:hypothetical protein